MLGLPTRPRSLREFEPPFFRPIHFFLRLFKNTPTTQPTTPPTFQTLQHQAPLIGERFSFSQWVDDVATAVVHVIVRFISHAKWSEWRLLETVRALFAAAVFAVAAASAGAFAFRPLRARRAARHGRSIDDAC